MFKYFTIIISVLFIHGSIFGIDLNNINFYRYLENTELLLVIRLLEREKHCSQNNELFTYIDLANQALTEKGIKIINENTNLDSMQHNNDLKYLKNCKNTKFILKASKDLNLFIYCDGNDGFFKTLDGRNIGFQDGKFVILDPLPFKGYENISSEHSTIEIYNASILEPDFSKFILDQYGPYVYVEELNKKVYFDDIAKLSNEESLFLFYDLFPVSRLKGIKDWYEFGFSSILKEIKKAYNIAISLNVRKIK